MLVLCYVSPAVCDVAKHWQAIANAALQARYAQCQQVQNTMAYAGLRLRGGQTSQCLEEKANEGSDLNSAMAACNKVEKLRTPAGQDATQIDLVRETLHASGASRETQALMRNLMGEVTLTAQGSALGSQQQRPAHSLLKRYEEHRRDAESHLRDAVSQLASTGTISDTMLRDISVPGQAMPRAALDALVALQRDPVRMESLLQKLATGLSLTHLTWEVHELHGTLAAAEGVNTQLTDEQRRLIQQRLEALQRELEQVTQKKATIEQHLQPAIEALLHEYSAVQQEAARVGIRAPSMRPKRTPYRGQGPMGYGQ
jgi:DNA repair exonuclease SbcCD ATPase subunit